MLDVKTRNHVFEDLIADFLIEEGRDPDIEEMAWMTRCIQRYEANSYAD